MLPRAESEEEGRWERELGRGLLLVCIQEERRMDPRGQLLGLALKKRRATPPHSGGKEVRERMRKLKFVAAETHLCFIRLKKGNEPLPPKSFSSSFLC